MDESEIRKYRSGDAFSRSVDGNGYMMRDVAHQTRRDNAYNKDWTQGSIIGNLWGLAWPMTISGVVETLGPTVDMIWVGKLGSTAVASVGVAGTAVMLVNAARMGLNMGIRAMIARFVGAGDEEGANHVAQQSLIVSALFAICLAVIGIFFSEAILRLLGVEQDVVVQGGAYMRVQFIGSIFFSLGMMARGVMQASGDALLPMKLTIGTRILHGSLSPLLVFGWWIFPKMGVTGPAVTSIVAEGIGAVLGQWILFTGRSRLKLTMKNFHFDGNVVWRIIKIGIPASVTSMGQGLSQFLVMSFIAPFGTFAVAAHSLLGRVGMFLQMPAMGFGQAAGVLAGQNLGADQPARAEKTGWIAAALFTGIMLVSSIIIWFWAEYVVRLFNSEAGLVDITSAFMRIELVNYLVFGIVMTLSSCLNGVGDTVVTMIATLFTIWAVQIPLAYFLPRVSGLGVYGVRWALVAGTIMRALIFTVYFKVGNWKHKQV